VLSSAHPNIPGKPIVVSTAKEDRFVDQATLHSAPADGARP
jgi:hypothetical protein